MKDYTWENKKYIFLSIMLLFIIWGIGAKSINNETIIPSIGSTYEALIEIINNKNFINIIGFTLLRSFLSFLISILTALVLGLLAYEFRIIHNLFKPILSILKSVPTMAIVILALIWLDSEKAPVLIGFIVIFPILYDSIVSALISMDIKILNMAKLFKVKKITIIKNIYIPCIFGGIYKVIASVLGLNFKVVIAGEVLGQPKYSIGSSLQMEKLYLNTSGVFAWIIIVVVLTIIFETLIKLIYKSKARWKY